MGTPRIYLLLVIYKNASTTHSIALQQSPQRYPTKFSLELVWYGTPTVLIVPKLVLINVHVGVSVSDQNGTAFECRQLVLYLNQLKWVSSSY